MSAHSIGKGEIAAARAARKHKKFNNNLHLVAGHLKPGHHTAHGIVQRASWIRKANY